MAKDESFDVVSKVDMQEVNNAINQTMREVEQRFDLKGTGTEVTIDKEQLILKGPDDMKIRNLLEMVQMKLVKRGISLKSLDYGDVESSLGGKVKQAITIKQGIDKDLAKKITTLVKESKIKVNAQIQEDQIRISGKNRDDLQRTIQLLKEADLDGDLQFINFR